MGRISASFEPKEHGWAVFSLTIDGAQIRSEEFNATGEELGDILRLGLLAASGGGGEAWFSYEPGDLRMVCTRYRDCGPGRIPMMRVQAYEVSRPGSQGNLVFNADCQADEFAAQMLALGRDVLARLGPEGYEAQFNHLFPQRALEVLAFAVTEAKAPNHSMARTEEDEIVRTIIITE